LTDLILPFFNGKKNILVKMHKIAFFSEKLRQLQANKKEWLDALFKLSKVSIQIRLLKQVMLAKNLI